MHQPCQLSGNAHGRFPSLFITAETSGGICVRHRRSTCLIGHFLTFWLLFPSNKGGPQNPSAEAGHSKGLQRVAAGSGCSFPQVTHPFL